MVIPPIDDKIKAEAAGEVPAISVMSFPFPAAGHSSVAKPRGNC